MIIILRIRPGNHINTHSLSAPHTHACIFLLSVWHQLRPSRFPFCKQFAYFQLLFRKGLMPHIIRIYASIRLPTTREGYQQFTLDICCEVYIIYIVYFRLISCIYWGGKCLRLILEALLMNISIKFEAELQIEYELQSIQASYRSNSFLLSFITTPSSAASLASSQSWLWLTVNALNSIINHASACRPVEFLHFQFKCVMVSVTPRVCVILRVCVHHLRVYMCVFVPVYTYLCIVTPTQTQTECKRLVLLLFCCCFIRFT